MSANLRKIASRVALPVKALKVKYDPESYVDLFKNFAPDVVIYESNVDLTDVFRIFDKRDKKSVERLIHSRQIKEEQRESLIEFLTEYYDAESFNIIKSPAGAFAKKALPIDNDSAGWLGHDIGHLIQALGIGTGYQLRSSLNHKDLFTLSSVDDKPMDPALAKGFFSERTLMNAIVSQLSGSFMPSNAAFARNLEDGPVDDLYEDLAILAIQGVVKPEIEYDFKDLYFYGGNENLLLTRDSGERPCIKASPSPGQFNKLKGDFKWLLGEISKVLSDYVKDSKGQIVMLP